jgi:[ribosomal protein S5]-alanine N-acetyltransferase
MKTFTGARIFLRPMRENDATETYAAWLCDPEVNQYLSTKNATLEELRWYITKKNTQEDTELYGIFLRNGQKHIGTVKLEPIDFSTKKATIGIMIGDKQEWGKGFAGEAMQLLIDYCCTQLGMNEVVLGVLGQNTSAIRAYEKLGFKEVKRELKAVTYPNGIFDQITMSLMCHA